MSLLKVVSAILVLGLAITASAAEKTGGSLKFTGLDGKDGPWSGNALASNGFLHDQALAMVQPQE